MALAPTVVVVAPLIQMATTWLVMVLPEIDVPLIEAASGSGERLHDQGDGRRSTAPRWRRPSC